MRVFVSYLSLQNIKKSACCVCYSMKWEDMAVQNEKLLVELLKLSGNGVCADCGSKCESQFMK